MDFVGFGLFEFVVGDLNGGDEGVSEVDCAL